MQSTPKSCKKDDRWLFDSNLDTLEVPERLFLKSVENPEAATVVMRDITG